MLGARPQVGARPPLACRSIQRIPQAGVLAQPSASAGRLRRRPVRVVRCAAAAASSGSNGGGSGGGEQPQQQHDQHQQQQQQHHEQQQQHEAAAAPPPPRPASAVAAAAWAGSVPSPAPPPPPGGRWERALSLPLLLASALRDINGAYLRRRVRQRGDWWSELGGYPRVPQVPVPELPEPAIELWHKVAPLGLIFFAASFNLSVLQSLKDSIVVVAGGGAEALPFLQSLVVLPASVAFFFAYGRMVAKLPERAVFYAAAAPLLVLYALFATVVFPIAPSLHFDLSAVEAALPAGLHGLVKVAANWTYSAFFCAAELWGSVVISVLFWSLANDTVTVDEAKAVYPFMAIGANLALVAAGTFVRAVNSSLPAGAAGQLLGLRALVGAVIAMAGVMFAAKAFLDATVTAPMRAAEARAAAADAAAAAAAAAANGGAHQPPKKEKKPKHKARGTFSENFAVLRGSAKIRNLALLVMCYGVGHRLFEFAWKGQLRVLHPTVQGYQSVLADVSTYTGALTLASMFASRLVFRHLGWGAAAAVTPLVMGGAGAAFFCASLLAHNGGCAGALAWLRLPEGAAAAMGGVAAAAGIVTQVFARSSKYALFDPAKEMVYIEMDRDEKRRGKAAVDLVGSQIGKSGGAWVTQVSLLACGSMAAALPATFAVFAVVIAVWLTATAGLHRLMRETDAARQKAAAAAAAVAGVNVTATDGGGALAFATTSSDDADSGAATPAARAAGGQGAAGASLAAAAAAAAAAEPAAAAAGAPEPLLSDALRLAGAGASGADSEASSSSSSSSSDGRRAPKPSAV